MQLTQVGIFVDFKQQSSITNYSEFFYENIIHYKNHQIQIDDNHKRT